MAHGKTCTIYSAKDAALRINFKKKKKSHFLFFPWNMKSDWDLGLLGNSSESFPFRQVVWGAVSGLSHTCTMICLLEWLLFVKLWQPTLLNGMCMLLYYVTVCLSGMPEEAWRLVLFFPARTCLLVAFICLWDSFRSSRVEVGYLNV